MFSTIGTWLRRQPRLVSCHRAADSSDCSESTRQGLISLKSNQFVDFLNILVTLSIEFDQQINK